MIRKFTLIVLFLFMLGITSFSQTASLANVYASPGEDVPVALSVQAFSGIGSITFNIQFDAAVMSYTGMSLLPGTPSGFTAYVTGNTLNLVGSWTSFPTFPDGPILNLNFTYNGMTTATLNFLGSCAVTQGVTPISPTYGNGSVSMAVLTTKATLIPTVSSTGDEANVDLTYENISGNVGAITQKIKYDPTKLTFVNVTGTGVLAVGINSSVNSAAGVITLTWSKTGGGANINTSGVLNKFVLKFIFIGNSTTSVDFVGGCILSNAVGTNINMYYESGAVSPSPYTAYAVLGSVPNAQQGGVVEVPLTLSGFVAGAIGGTQSFTLNIPYSVTKLDYVGLKNPVAGLTVSAASGSLNLVWTDASGPDINGVFATFKFEYKGIGTANVDFGNNCVFNTNTSGTIGTVQVGYTNATIVPANALANATLGFVAGISGSNVLVPLTFSDLPLMGALTIKIFYDGTKLIFAGAQNKLFSSTSVGVNTDTHIITIAWENSAGVSINTKFLDLEFEYAYGGGVASAAVNFSDGCELSHVVGTSTVIIPTNYVNGGVNFIFTVSGTLLYDNHPPYTSTLAGFTVNLRDAGNNIVGTDVTDGSGNYSIAVPNGIYTIEGLAPIDPLDAPWFASELSHDIIFYYANGFNYIDDETPLKVQAMDVNLDGYPLEDDADLVFYRANGYYYPEFSAQDWLFEIPSITVSNADLTGQTFFGICSGDVAGEGPIF